MDDEDMHALLENTGGMIDREIGLLEAQIRDKELLPDRLRLAGWIDLS